MRFVIEVTRAAFVDGSIAVVVEGVVAILAGSVCRWVCTVAIAIELRAFADSVGLSLVVTGAAFIDYTVAIVIEGV